MRPVLLDLFCKAGGCTRGYQMSGFYVVGVDIEAQPRYIGDAFIQADALKIMADLVAGKNIVDSTGGAWQLSDFSAIHASPPCQAYSVLQSVWSTEDHPKLINRTRQSLQATGKPYVIENVPGAPLQNPVMLCGSMFGLRVYRHRLFESNSYMLMPPHIPHRDKTPKAGTRGPAAISPKGYMCVVGNFSNKLYAERAMGIDWMTRDELAQAVPPAYTQWIGERLMESLEVYA